MLECVINISEGRDSAVIDAIGAAAGPALLDVHRDPHHHRSVLTVVGEEPARSVVAATVATVDLSGHEGAHPRLGAADVVPFVPLAGSELTVAVAARDRVARWLGDELGVPCFLYGPERSLPDVRRGAFSDLAPDTGSSEPHPTAGATAVGARGVLVAYNVWLAGADVDLARRLAAEVRRPTLRALGLQVGARTQVSMNLVDPLRLGPERAFDLVAAAAAALGADVAGTELVGLVPARVLEGIAAHRWSELDLDPDRTIEARLEQAGFGDGVA